MTAAAQEPPWLTAAVDQRLKAAEAAFHYAQIAGTTVLMLTLTDPEEDTDLAREHWDQSCDNCRRFCGQELWPGHKKLMHNGMPVVITFGVCSDCKEGFL